MNQEYQSPPVALTRHDDARSDARLMAENAANLARVAKRPLSQFPPHTYEQAIALALASIALSLAFKS